MNIPEILCIPADQCDVGCLQEGLQAAIALEHSTLPPYLCAMWSIKEQNYTAYNLIRSIVMEEMVHLSLACNMLAAVGGQPKFDTLNPKYPGPLPGDVHPDLTVSLGGLTREQISEVFLEIEKPEHLVPKSDKEKVPTIGRFYDHIRDVFNALGDEVIVDKEGKNQVADDIGIFPITSLDDALTAIKKIKDQGEGSGQSPESRPEFGEELSHYYKFKEILKGKRYVPTKCGPWDYVGDPIQFPSVIDVPRIPVGGYKNVPPDAQATINTFNQKYTDVLGRVDE